MAHFLLLFELAHLWIYEDGPSSKRFPVGLLFILSFAVGYQMLNGNFIQGLLYCVQSSFNTLNHNLQLYHVRLYVTLIFEKKRLSNYDIPSHQLLRDLAETFLVCSANLHTAIHRNFLSCPTIIIPQTKRKKALSVTYPSRHSKLNMQHIKEMLTCGPVGISN